METLIQVCKDGNIELVKELIDTVGVNINCHDVCGDTALIWASLFGHVEIVKELIKAGANVNLQDKYGETALMWASQNGHVEVVKELIDTVGANVELRDKNGDTALMWASHGGHVEVVKLIKAHIWNRDIVEPLIEFFQPGMIQELLTVN